MIHEVESGEQLDGRFRVLRELSRGGFGVVYDAMDTQTGRRVAIKVPHPHVEADAAGYSRYLREAEIGAQLNHPSVLRFVAVPESEKTRPYLVTEYLEGETLAAKLGRGETFDIPRALAVGIALCDALEYLRQRDIVHRDLKPGNVMMCPDGSVRLMDFGLARAGVGRRLTFTGFTSRFGTPDYMAPEQVRGQRGDQRTDIYSLGAILYQMLTGHIPFEGGNDYERMNARLSGDPASPRRWRPDLSREVEEILLHALARQPFDRYPNAAAMKADLACPSKVAVTGRAARLQPARAGRRSSRAIRLVAIALAAPVVLFLILLFLLKR